jgi:hypothetical protein
MNIEFFISTDILHVIEDVPRAQAMSKVLQETYGSQKKSVKRESYLTKEQVAATQKTQMQFYRGWCSGGKSRVTREHWEAFYNDRDRMLRIIKNKDME